MSFRTHLGRSLDLRLRTHLILAVLFAVTAVISALRWSQGSHAVILTVPAHVFLIWALLREMDPDHDTTALIGALGVAVWGLTGGDLTSALAVLGLMVMARVASHTTGRRPLPTDLVAVTLFGVGLGLVAVGWVVGFGIAIALYADHRMRADDRRGQLLASMLTAIGCTVAAAFAERLPQTVLDVRPGVAIAAGVVSLVLVIRATAHPTSRVDARHAALLDRNRIHVSRSTVGLVIFAMSVLAGGDGHATLPLIAASTLCVLSNEIELLRRRAH